MTEEIIATAIREAFNCGKEAGEAYQRMWSNMNEKIEKAKKGEPDYPRGLYDGFLSPMQGMQVKVEPAKPDTESEEVPFQVQAVPGNRIGAEPNENVAKLEAEVNELGRSLEEKDATITDLRRELQVNKDADTLLGDENKRLLESLNKKDEEIAKLRIMLSEGLLSEVDTEE